MTNTELNLFLIHMKIFKCNSLSLKMNGSQQYAHIARIKRKINLIFRRGEGGGGEGEKTFPKASSNYYCYYMIMNKILNDFFRYTGFRLSKRFCLTKTINEFIQKSVNKNAKYPHQCAPTDSSIMSKTTQESQVWVKDEEQNQT